MLVVQFSVYDKCKMTLSHIDATPCVISFGFLMFWKEEREISQIKVSIFLPRSPIWPVAMCVRAVEMTQNVRYSPCVSHLI